MTPGLVAQTGLPTTPPKQISPVYCDLHATHREEAERLFSL
ncbi:hypothetical protein [Streptomyces doebereineriae]|uniref:Uncharacterized protein n=1 Tax=Streptomyces doebereineriae TaxID=3075528 RepID=A0ABU2VGJ3_9ACTN|nr:hypothetical protein [Streptomyces sp. DSM 41640]MDT0484360.1 hypothetical protein [Streptomyces sp. DSM 41640]